MNSTSRKLSFALMAALLLTNFQSVSGKATTVKKPLRVQKIPESRFSGAAAKFTDADSQLQFDYPRAATVLTHPDKDTVAKIEGTLPSGSGYSISLQNLDSISGTVPAEASQWIQKFVLQKLTNYRKLDSATVWIGKHSLIPGQSDLISFTHDGQAYRQRWVYFNDAGDNKKLKLLSALASEKDFAAADGIFNAVLLSVENRNAPHAVAQNKPVSKYGNQNRAGGEASFETFSNQVLSVSYPAGWQQVSGERDTVVKVKSPESAGSFELTIARQELYPGLTVEEFAESLEQNHFSQLTQYRKLKQSYCTAGTGGRLSGLKESLSFEINKIGAQMQCFIFIQGNHIYTATLTSAGVEGTEATKKFDQILATMSVH